MAFDTLWVDDLYKLMVLNFPSYFVRTNSSYMHGWTFEASFQASTFTCCGMRARVTQRGLVSSILFCLCVDIPAQSHHVELVLYADDTAIMATSRKPVLLLSYQKSYLGYPEWWLRGWRIAMNVSKSTLMLFAKAGRHNSKLHPVQLSAEPIHWVDRARFLGVDP